jgi:hypothetical protein
MSHSKKLIFAQARSFVFCDFKFISPLVLLRSVGFVCLHFKRTARKSQTLFGKGNRRRPLGVCHSACSRTVVRKRCAAGEKYPQPIYASVLPQFLLKYSPDEEGQ